MTGGIETLHVARQWVEKAEEDLTNARHTLILKERCPYGTICFHAQQVAEKYLKALLTFHARPFPKSHDLLDLLRRLQDGPKIQIELLDLAILNRYAVEVRYPGDWEPILREEAEDAIKLAERIRAEVRRHLPLS